MSFCSTAQNDSQGKYSKAWFEIIKAIQATTPVNLVPEIRDSDSKSSDLAVAFRDWSAVTE